ncbi:MAG TPA: hypothetical protein DIW80_05320 [Gordonia polyisoprenivorans]|nr:hypothetical protein [Gordonia polyisoprenivorans]
MNQSAVALAADSTVSIGRSKTYDSVNKLFELIKGSNIGVMIYNNASINGTPWETVIKAYRRENSGFTAAYVSDYRDHFFKFISDHEDLLSPADEGYAIIGLCLSRAMELISRLENFPEDIATASGKIVKTRLRSAVDTIIEETAAEDKARHDQMTAAGLITYPADVTKLESEFFGIVSNFVHGFICEENGLAVTAAQEKRLARLWLSDIAFGGADQFDTGIVFAGFGTKDYFPSMVSSRVAARLSGGLIGMETQSTKLSVDSPGDWMTFAQDGPARGWANGIHDDMRHAVKTELNAWTHSRLPQETLDKLQAEGFSKADATKAARVVGDIAHGYLHEFGTYMAEYERRFFQDPMSASIAVLPKGDLGLLAESFVNLTSLRQRMSINQMNTVGGPIDVAVISIGDGFVWMNRKHYFSDKLNPSWHLTHQGRLDYRSETNE